MPVSALLNKRRLRDVTPGELFVARVADEAAVILALGIEGRYIDIAGLGFNSKSTFKPMRMRWERTDRTTLSYGRDWHFRASEPVFEPKESSLLHGAPGVCVSTDEGYVIYLPGASEGTPSVNFNLNKFEFHTNTTSDDVVMRRWEIWVPEPHGTFSDRHVVASYSALSAPTT